MARGGDCVREEGCWKKRSLGESSDCVVGSISGSEARTVLLYHSENTEVHFCFVD